MKLRVFKIGFKIDSQLDGCAYWLMERRISFSPKQSSNANGMMILEIRDSVYVAATAVNMSGQRSFIPVGSLSVNLYTLQIFKLYILLRI